MTAAMLGVMIVLLLLGFPMMVPLIAGSFVAFFIYMPIPPEIMVQQMLAGIRPSALVAVPMIALLVRDAPLSAIARRIWPSRAVWSAIGIALVLSLAVADRHRVLESQDIPELYPTQALAFVAEQGVAKRPFSTIGFGSFMLWKCSNWCPHFSQT